MEHYSTYNNITSSSRTKHYTPTKDVQEPTPVECPCPDPVFVRASGKAIVEHDMFFVPPIDTECVDISFEICSNNAFVELVCCGFIIVCGIFTKTVTEGSCPSSRVFVEDIPFQAIIENDNITDLDPDNWVVEAVEVCNSCFRFTCFVPDTDKAYKLMEKDIIAVTVKKVNRDC